MPGCWLSATGEEPFLRQPGLPVSSSIPGKERITPIKRWSSAAAICTAYFAPREPNRRGGSSAYIILLTLADRNGDFISLENRKRYMEMLGKVIQRSVRAGDVFTQYSSCQFLLMVLDASRENALQIGQRIQQEFQALTPEGPAICLEHDISPLRPAGEEEDAL